MVNKSDIGTVLSISNKDSKYEFYTVDKSTWLIVGYGSVLEQPLTPLVLPDIESEEGLFHDHTGTRFFYIDTDLTLQEFLPATRETVTPTDYDSIQIVSGDTPLMLLSDKSLLVEVGGDIIRVTATTRDTPQSFTVDGASCDVLSLNFIGDRGCCDVANSPGLQRPAGSFEFNGVMPTNIIEEVEYFTPQKRISATSGNRIIGMSSITAGSPLKFSIFNNLVDDSSLIYETQSIAGINSFGCASLYEIPPNKFTALLNSIDISNPTTDTIADEAGNPVLFITPGRKVLELTTQENMDVFMDGEVETLDVNGETYEISSISAVDVSTYNITLQTPEYS